MTALLPYISAEIPGISGQLKAEAADFIVEELPCYEPDGQGEHVFVRIEREMMTTRDMTRQLSWIFGLDEVAIGYAGLKDKHARTTQTLSLHLPTIALEDVVTRIEAEVPVKVLAVTRNGHKLRRGHLSGNRFCILLRTDDPEAVAKACAIEAVLAERGMANYFGDQRFGRDQDNADAGTRILTGRRRRRDWKGRLLLSAWQSDLFNKWLTARIEAGEFEQLRAGDVVKKLETGGLFIVDDLSLETPRLQRREIAYTGPLFGFKLMAAHAAAGAIEAAVLQATGITHDQLAWHRLAGTRRLARLWPNHVQIVADPLGVRFSFTLPKGVYATTYLREFMKPTS